MWGEDLKEDIAGDFMRGVVNTVSAACQDCVLNSQNIQLDVPTCDEQVEQAAIFRGTVSTESSNQTKDIFCTLRRWQQSGPLMWINMSFYPVDRGYSLEFRPPILMECTSHTISIVATIMIVGIPLMLLIGLLVVVVIRKNIVQQKGMVIERL
jgi:hypothetical protein